MGKKRAAPQQPEAEDPEMLQGPAQSGSDAEDGGSDEGNEYGMGGTGSEDDGDSGGSERDGEGASDEERQEEDKVALAGAGAGPGILGLASGSDDEDDGDIDDDLPSDRGEDDDADEDGAPRVPGSSDADDEAGGSGSGGDSDGGGGGGGGRAVQHASFLSGEKGASFAKAFSKILGKPAKGAAKAAEGKGGLILAESAGVQKRRKEEEDDAEARHEAKKQRLAMKKRGHLPVPRKGEDPAHDVREKALQRLATRGVVLLFNAVNKAQKQKAEAEAAGGVSKRKAAAAKLGKASFLAELKQAATVGVPVEAAGAQQQQKQGKGKGQQQQQQQQRDPGGGAGWEVLGEGFPGLTGGAKMKDWDRRGSGSEDEIAEQPRLAEAEVSSDEGDGW